MELIRIRHLNKFFGEGNARVHILQDINLSIDQGEFVAIMGQSGSGKSTLMNLLGCLDTPTSGSYLLHGRDVARLSANQLAELRGETFGFIFQRYNLLSSLMARDNVSLPAAYSGVPHKDRTARAASLLSDLGLGDKLANRPNELSGGQQQRVSIARALINGGEILLADEPTGALDSASGEMVMDILKKLHRQGHTIILVTHDRQIAGYADRIIELHDGKVTSDQSLEGAKTQAPYRRPEKRTTSLFNRYRDQLLESFAMSVQAIAAHKLRSILTMLGIIIGIASVVSVIALGKGSQEKILSDISAMGTNTINIYPGAGFGDVRAGQVKTLTVRDSEVLGKQEYLDSSTPNSSASGLLTYRNVSLTATLSGVGELYFDVKGLAVESGRLFNSSDVLNNSSVVVLDQNARKELFPSGEDPLGKVILFNRQPLEVIGVTKKQDTVFGPTSSLNLWAPYTTVMNKITGNRHIDSIVVKVKDTVNSQVAEKNLTSLLAVRHGGMADFHTMNTDTIKQTIESTTGTMALLISCIALISLVVGGIGVMNIMLVSVTERTREIGVRMSIGAKRHHILEQFLIEAVLLCLIGGLAGIALSYIIGYSFNIFASSFRMTFSLASVLLALTCSSLIGVLFGFMPARNASRLNPIEALARD